MLAAYGKAQPSLSEEALREKHANIAGVPFEPSSRGNPDPPTKSKSMIRA